MARKKRRGGRRGLRVGKYINLGFKILGGVVSVSPSFRGLKSISTGDIEGGADAIVYDFTGFSPRTGVFNAGAAGKGLGTVVAGLLLAKLGSYIARRY